MIITPDNSWNEESDSDEFYDSDSLSPKSLEQQEQENSEKLSRLITEENEVTADSGEITEESSRGEDMTGFLENAVSAEESYAIEEEDRPLTKNLLGDNPPGAEQAAFDAGNVGDAGSDLFKYNTENFIEGFRENLEKTEEQINLDKKLKNDLKEESD